MGDPLPLGGRGAGHPFWVPTPLPPLSSFFPPQPPVGISSQWSGPGAQTGSCQGGCQRPFHRQSWSRIPGRSPALFAPPAVPSGRCRLERAGGESGRPRPGDAHRSIAKEGSPHGPAGLLYLSPSPSHGPPSFRDNEWGAVARPRPPPGGLGGGALPSGGARGPFTSRRGRVVGGDFWAQGVSRPGRAGLVRGPGGR